MIYFISGSYKVNELVNKLWFDLDGELSWSQDGRYGGLIRVRRKSSSRSFGGHSGALLMLMLEVR